MRLEDFEPAGGGEEWWWDTTARTDHSWDPASFIPPGVFAALHGMPPEAVNPDYHSSRLYPSREAALAALRDALAKSEVTT
jgi:hypothetical protein